MVLRGGRPRHTAAPPPSRVPIPPMERNAISSGNVGASPARMLVTACSSRPPASADRNRKAAKALMASPARAALTP